jgi:hypothetical protein
LQQQNRTGLGIRSIFLKMCVPYECCVWVGVYYLSARLLFCRAARFFRVG